MKKEALKGVFLIAVISFCWTSCSNQDEFDEFNAFKSRSTSKELVLSKSISSEFDLNESTNPVNGETKGFYELRIRYASHVTTEKQKQEVRNRYDVVDFKDCNCRGFSEIWRFRISNTTKDTREEMEEDDEVDEVDENI